MAVRSEYLFGFFGNACKLIFLDVFWWEWVFRFPLGGFFGGLFVCLL